MISGPFITVMWAPTSLAMARPIIVFPVPGGPYRRTPLGGGIPVVDNRLKLEIGHLIRVSKSNCNTSHHVTSLGVSLQHGII